MKKCFLFTGVARKKHFSTMVPGVFYSIWGRLGKKQRREKEMKEVEYSVGKGREKGSGGTGDFLKATRL